MCNCCPSLLKFVYAFTDRYTGARRYQQPADAVLQDAKFSLSVYGWATCSRCGDEPEDDLEWTTYDEFVSHRETVEDPL
ncbi:hypothetical protein HOS47_gp08 [Pseudomonas phage uligo]|uniref:Uncharacterized protein n=1 Tax=Pseudomonas phage uligo TaxID=2048979 RepID=A0A2H4P7Q3_9CAUD|nr:hypothetical protein HOS47_gp08 [Pseudomonas phage uligo]ATW58213.1 hypothetical protein [Pseudomonas phage uligo]